MGGIPAIASGDSNRTYYHGWLPVTSTPPPTPPSHPFTDIGSSKFRNDIIWAWEEGITAGCTATRYCPDGLVTRGAVERQRGVVRRLRAGVVTLDAREIAQVGMVERRVPLPAPLRRSAK